MPKNWLKAPLQLEMFHQFPTQQNIQSRCPICERLFDAPRGEEFCSLPCAKKGRFLARLSRIKTFNPFLEDRQ